MHLYSARFGSNSKRAEKKRQKPLLMSMHRLKFSRFDLVRDDSQFDGLQLVGNPCEQTPPDGNSTEDRMVAKNHHL
jgi:hypothetical protein